MNVKLCLILFAAFALVAVLPLLFGVAEGDAFIAVKPVVQATYRDDGADKLDDELFHGVTGVILAEPDVDGRYLVETRYKCRARIHQGDVRRCSVEEAAAWEKSLSHCVAAPFADVVAAPDLKAYAPLLTLPRGSLLPVLGEEGEYFRIRLADGRAGYLRRQALRPLRSWETTDAETNRRRVVDDALSYLGVPYRWGGKTPIGIDCSGLASAAYLLNGLAIYRNSRPQAGFPIAVMQVPAPAGGHTRKSLAKAKPGDLIYWPGHQGVYIGDGKFVHANATDFKVSVNSLLRGDSDYRAELADPAMILAWGTAYPEAPDKLIVRSFDVKATDEKGVYKFYAKVEGYAPTGAVIYPEGFGDNKGEDVPILNVDPRSILYEIPGFEDDAAPRYRYAAPGVYRPAVVFFNIDGWSPDGRHIDSGIVESREAVTVE